ncbi:MAG: hypothetical protein OXI01_19890 [Albidovulum sp.]|nr:hypothetical protein [Albidovulum sp.]
MAKPAPATDAAPEDLVRAMVCHGPIAASGLTMTKRSTGMSQSRSGEASVADTVRRDDRVSRVLAILQRELRNASMGWLNQPIPEVHRERVRRTVERAENANRNRRPSDQ